jgi:hypothetical protein
VAIELARVPLTALAGADAEPLPAGLGQPVVAGGVPLGGVVHFFLLAAGSKPVDHGIHARNAARDRHGVRALLDRVHRAREFDDAVADRADVHGALAKDRVVAERFQHALLEYFVHVVALREIVVGLVIVVRRVGVVPRARLAGAGLTEPIPYERADAESPPNRWASRTPVASPASAPTVRYASPCDGSRR